MSLSCDRRPPRPHDHEQTPPSPWLLPSPFQSNICPCGTRTRPRVWASVHRGHAGCVHPTGPGAGGLHPTFWRRPCSPHTCVNPTITQLFFLGTHSPMQGERKQRPPSEQTGSPTRARPSCAQSTLGPIPSCGRPQGPFSGLRAFRGPQRGLHQSTEMRTPAQGCTCPGNAGLKTLRPKSRFSGLHTVCGGSSDGAELRPGELRVPVV